MENIEKKISLETAKNRLNFEGIRLPMLSGTSFVYDIKFNDTDNPAYLKGLPLVKNSKGETILRFKNLMNKYYWLTNKFIPSCEFYRYCLRNGENKWVMYKDLSNLRGECFVKFVNGYDGSLINSVMILKGDIYSPTTVPQREGYDFIGWFDSAVGGNEYDFSQPIENDVTVYAHYLIQDHIVTFIYYDGTSQMTETVVVPHGGSVDESDVPDADNYVGHTFEGWSGPYENVVRDITTVAQYSIVQFTILFYTQDELYAEEKIDYSGIAERPETPYQEYYDFVNWLVSGTTDYFDFTQPITEDYTLVAEFTPQEYTVTFADWDGTVFSQEIGVTHDTILEIDFTPTRQGYIFKEWSWPDSDPSTSEYTMSGFTGDMTVVAIYTADELHADFVLMGLDNQFEVYSSVTYSYNGIIGQPQTPTEDQYDPSVYGVFDGWYEDSDFTIPFNFDLTRNIDNLQIYGKWKTEFIVTFYNWDGTLITGTTFVNPQMVRYGQDANVPDESIVLPFENYPLDGWDPSATNITSDREIQPVFSVTRSWTVNFVNTLTGGTIATVYVYDGGNIDPETIPTPAEIYGYTFSGWDKPLTNITGNMTIYTVYDKVSFIVTYIDHDGETLGATSQEYLTTGSTPQSIEVPDIQIYQEDPNLGYNVLCPYSFNGEYWLVGDETGITPEMVIITGETTFQAQYEQNGPCEIVPFEIIINAYNNTYYTTIYNKHYGEYITVNDMSELEQYINVYPEPASAYTFYGLVDINGNEYPKDQDILITEPMTYTMKYEPLSYTFNFIDTVTGEAIGAQQRIRIDQKLLPQSIPSAPYHENYEWVTNNDNTLWYTDSACTQVFDFQEYYTDPSPIPEGTVYNLYAKYIRRFNITIHYLTDSNE